MTKRGIKNTPSLAIARERWSIDDVKTIIAKTGLAKISPMRRNRLALRLEKAAERWALDNYMQSAPTSRMLEDRFARIDKAAQKLLKEIGVGPSGGLSSIRGPILDRLHMASIKRAAALGKRGDLPLREAISGVVQLRRWSNRLARIERERRADRTAARHTGDRALKRAIVELGNIYLDAWGREPGISTTKTSEIIGPFFRFLCAALDVMGSSYDHQALGAFAKAALANRDKSTAK